MAPQYELLVHIKMNPELSIVSPVYGCENCLDELAERIQQSLEGVVRDFELILVDDRAPICPWARIEELARQKQWVKGIRLSRNFGQHPAISAGLAHARGEMIVVMDCDLQDLPEEIPALLQEIRKGADIVLAQRVSRRDGPFKRLSSVVFYKALTWLTGVQQDHTVANFGAYSRRVIDTVLSLSESSRFFPLLVKWTGFEAVKLPVRHARRTDGKSAYSFTRMLALALEVSIAYSDKPLRLSINVGVAFAFLAAIIVSYAIVAYFEGRTTVAGFTSLLASIWLTAGVIQITLGVLGVYLGRVYVETKSRPVYIVQETTQDLYHG